MALGDLTTLDHIKGWRNPPIETDAQDPALRRIITAASIFVLNDLQRALLSQAYTETRDGDGSHVLLVDQWPVTAVSSVTVNGTAVVAATSADPSNTGFTGYVFDKKGKLTLRGSRFTRGVQNVVVQYTAGFLVAGEAQIVPGGAFQLATTELVQTFAGDAGVSFAGGAALVAVTSAPVTGQYIPPKDVDGSYQFAAADAGRAIQVSYSYTPADLDQACAELVILRVNEAKHIGITSQGLAGENAQWFSKGALTPSIDAALQNYRRVVIAT